jgi:hypothetical protein
MCQLAREITIVIIDEFGPKKCFVAFPPPFGSKPLAVFWATTGIPVVSLPPFVALYRKG